MSPVAAFVRERCTVGPYEELVDVLYRQWKLWAEDNGNRAGSAQSFGRDLRAVVPGLKVVRHRDDGRALIPGRRRSVGTSMARTAGQRWTAPMATPRPPLSRRTTHCGRH